MRIAARRVAPVLIAAAFGLLAWEYAPALHLAGGGPAAALPTVESWTKPAAVPAAPAGYPYIEIVDSCGPYYAGTCVNVRSGPGANYPVVMQARANMVLKVASTTEADGRTWYEVGFDGEIHYPERVTGAWWVAADYARLFYDAGETATSSPDTASAKRIVVNLSKETLYAYDGDALVMTQPVSTGLELTPTPPGTFFVYRKMPDSYMQGPVPGVSDQYYDLPGVPWDLYFTKDGGAIHGAYWHDHFGRPWSHGCVNLPPAAAEALYEWAPLGTPVIVTR